MLKRFLGLMVLVFASVGADDVDGAAVREG